MKKLSILGSLLSILMLVIMAALPIMSSAITYPVTRTDDLGREVTVEAEPQTIVSLNPSGTEILFALGLGDKVVGVTPFCDYPPEALTKEKVGGPWGTSLNMEMIVALNPDFILAEEINGVDAINTIERLGFTVFGIKSTDLDDLLNDITTVGELTNRQAEATALVTDMQNSINAITSQTSVLTPLQKPRTLHIMWHDPIFTSGSNTFIHDLIEKAGGVNIFSDLQGWSAVNIETVIIRDPEAIVVTAMGGTSSETWEWVNTESRLADVSARVNGRLYHAESNWVERPGPRIVLGLELLAQYLHPEIFFGPWQYDQNSNGEISKAEAIKAVQDYFNGLITKAQAIEVVMLYFG